MMRREKHRGELGFLIARHQKARTTPPARIVRRITDDNIAGYLNMSVRHFRYIKAGEKHIKHNDAVEILDVNATPEELEKIIDYFLGPESGWEGPFERYKIFAQEFREVHKNSLSKSIPSIVPETLQLKPFSSNPFRGLAAMDEDWEDRFFGREAEKSAIFEKLRTNPVVAIIADSGAGKSSLAVAGIAPQWRKGIALSNEDKDMTCHVVTMRVRNDALTGLKSAILEASERFKHSEKVQTDRLDMVQLNDAFKTLRALECGLPVGKTQTLLILDQAEELLDLDETQRDLFGECLAAMVTMGSARDRLHIVVTLRIDCLDRFAAIKGIGPLIVPRAAQFRLRLPKPEQIENLIKQPLALVGYGNTAEQDALVQRIQFDLSDRDGDLALLQMALYLAWRDKDKECHGGSLLSAWQGIHNALGEEARRIEDDLRGRHNDNLLLPIFIRLIQLGENGLQATRRTAASIEFSTEARYLIDCLANEKNGRLLQLSDMKNRQDGSFTVEIAHEALILQWAFLNHYITEHQSEIRTLGDLIKRAGKWRASGYQENWLATGAELDDYVMLSHEKPEFLSSDENAFIQKSIRALRTHKIWRYASAFFVMVFLLVSIATFIIFSFEKRESRISQIKDLYARAEAKAQTDPVTAITWILASWPLLADEPVIAPERAVHVLSTALTQPRVIVKFTGHTAEINSVAFSHNGSHIITASDDGTARIWDAVTGQEKQIFSGYNSKVTAAAFSPDGKHNVIAYEDGTALVWNDARASLRLWGHKAKVTSAMFSPDPEGAYIVTASDDHSAILWSVATGKALLIISNFNSLLVQAAFSPDGSKIVTASGDGEARLWDISSVLNPGAGDEKTLVWDAATVGGSFLFQDPSPLTGAVFSPRGDQIATSSWDGIMRLWDVASQKEIRSFHGHTTAISRAAFSPDGLHLITSSHDGTARLWSVATGQSVAVFRGQGKSINAAAFSPEGTRAATVSDDGTAFVWDLTKGFERLSGVEPASAAVLLDGSPIISAAVSHDGRSRVTGHWNHQIRVTGTRELYFEAGNRPVTALAFSPDDQRIVTGAMDGAVHLWEARTGHRLMSFDGHTNKINSVVFSNDGAYVLTASDDGTVRLWNARTSETIRSFLDSQISINSAAFSNDGRLIVTASKDGTAKIWNTVTGEELNRFGGTESMISAAFSPDSSRIVTLSARTSHIWDVATQAPLLMFKGSEYISGSVTYLPDGKHVITTSPGKAAKVWTVDLVEGNILEVACRWLPYVDGARVLSSPNVPDDLRTINWHPVSDCGTYGKFTMGKEF